MVRPIFPRARPTGWPTSNLCRHSSLATTTRMGPKTSQEKPCSLIPNFNSVHIIVRASNNIAAGSSICNQIGPPCLPWWTSCLLNRPKDEVRRTVYRYTYYTCTPTEYSAQIDVCVFLLFAFHCEFLKRPISQSEHTKQTSAFSIHDASKNDANLALRECVLLLTIQGISLFISSRSLDCNFSPMGHSGQALHRRAGRPPLGWLQPTTPLVVVPRHTPVQLGSNLSVAELEAGCCTTRGRDRWRHVPR